MNDRTSVPEPKQPLSRRTLIREVAVRQDRILRGRASGPPNVWRYVGLIGLIGWTVVFPMLVGVALGVWIDRTWPSRFSWTLMLLVAGVAAGCANAWGSIRREQERR